MEYLPSYKDSLYLEHHGILGMKWGVRRFQNKDGSYTEAGRKRYGYDVEGAKKNLENARSKIDTADTYDKLQSAVADKEYAKSVLKSEKIKQKIDAQGGLTKTQEKYQKEYMDKGYPEEEAAIRAYKKDRTKRALMVAAGVAVTAAAAYGAYKYGQYACDSTLKKGTLFSRVAQNPDGGVHDAFYAVLNKNKGDVNAYNGLYAKQLSARGAKAFEKKIEVTGNLKIASPKNAADIMGKTLEKLNVRSNPDAAEGLKKALSSHRNMDLMLGAGERAKLYGKAIDDVDNYVKTGKVSKNLYDALNTNLANRNIDVTKQFYKDLKAAGYQGVKDMNDSKYSGYGTKLPLIIADASKVSVAKVRQLSDSDIEKAYGKYATKKAAKEFITVTGIQAIPYAGIYGSAVAAIAASSSINKNKIVSDYRKEHPNSQLTSAEIIRNYQKNNSK